MTADILICLMIPFLGTVLGAAAVLFMKSSVSLRVQQGLMGFAVGVMVAASVWSLLIPAMDQAESGGMGRLSFLPAAAGFWGGILFLLLLDKIIPHEHMNGEEEGLPSNLSHVAKLVMAVVLHNIPEGMAVGAVCASWYMGAGNTELAAVMALAVGMGIQNIPEGAIISLPLHTSGAGKGRAFYYGALSGAVEPVSAALTIAFSSVIVPALPYLLSFAAGAMLYVVVEELIPEMSSGPHSNIGVVMFALGFSLMMALDVGLG